MIKREKNARFSLQYDTKTDLKLCFGHDKK